MKAAKTHYMVTDAETQFAGAACALYEVADEEQKEIIKTELKIMHTLKAMLSGVPVDLDNLPKLENPLGLQKLFQEA